MNTARAFAMGELTRGQEPKVFDWDKAAEILVARGAKTARAGLSEDLEWTSGTILYEGKIVPKNETYTYLASTWAVPVLIIDEEEIACFRMKSETGWTADTYWPESARKILNGGV